MHVILYSYHRPRMLDCLFRYYYYYYYALICIFRPQNSVQKDIIIKKFLRRLSRRQTTKTDRDTDMFVSPVFSGSETSRIDENWLGKIHMNLLPSITNEENVNIYNVIGKNFYLKVNISPPFTQNNIQ